MRISLCINHLNVWPSSSSSQPSHPLVIMASPKILVLGATGPAGICLLRELLHRKHATRAYARNPSKIPEDLITNPLLEVLEYLLYPQLWLLGSYYRLISASRWSKSDERHRQAGLRSCQVQLGPVPFEARWLVDCAESSAPEWIQTMPAVSKSSIVKVKGE